MTLDDLKARWGKLAKREKFIMIAAMSFLALAIGNFAIWEPMAKSLNSARAEVGSKKLQLAKVAAERAALSAEVDARRPAGRKESKGDRQIAAAAQHGIIWQAAQADSWLREMVAGFGPGLALAAVGAAGDADPSLKGFYQHALELQATGSWSQVDAFLKSQSASSALSITKMSIVPKDGGVLELSAAIKALSPEEHWQERREADVLPLPPKAKPIAAPLKEPHE